MAQNPTEETKPEEPKETENEKEVRDFLEMTRENETISHE